MLDEDNTNHVYVYTNRISGDSIAQNSFFRFVLPTSYDIKSIEAIDNYLYFVWEEEMADSDGGDDKWTSVNTGRIYLKNEDLTLPRMDSLMKLSSSDILAGYPTYVNGVTTVVVKSPTLDVDTVVFWNDADPTNVRGDSVTVTPVANSNENYIQISSGTAGTSSVVNNYTATDGFYLGKKFTSTIKLSPQFWRGPELDVVNGTLNLRYGMFRFRNAGDFGVTVKRKDRTSLQKENNHVINITDARTSGLSYTPYTESGVFKIPVLGFNNDLDITLTSTSVHPVTISDIEFRGKFKFKNTSLGSM
tara:strand:- start:163 stop:1074 length:912 start_codon:yes stop_codon:yes gene_type:complete